MMAKEHWETGGPRNPRKKDCSQGEQCSILGVADLPKCVPAQSLQLSLTICNPMDCSPPGSSVHGSPWDSLGKNTRVDCHALLQGIFPTQRSNLPLLCLLHCRWILYSLSH